jgi:hypothetical protein
MRVPTAITFVVVEPARLSLRIWERGLSGALIAVRIARELIEPEHEPGPVAEPDVSWEPESPPLRREPEPPPAPAPEPRPTAAPEALGAEPAHVDEEAVLVAEVAEEGAADGAGAELHVDEPWAGYDRMPAPEVRRRLAGEDPTTAAAVKLYEIAGKKRRSILEVADRKLLR